MICRLLCILLLATSLQAQITTAPTQSPATAVKPNLERLAADTPSKTVLGNTFIAPRDWTLSVRGQATILEAPEADSWIALVDVPGKDADEALASAWKAYKPEASGRSR